MRHILYFTFITGILRLYKYKEKTMHQSLVRFKYICSEQYPSRVQTPAPHPDSDGGLPHVRYPAAVQQEIRRRKDLLMQPQSHYMERIERRLGNMMSPDSEYVRRIEKKLQTKTKSVCTKCGVKGKGKEGSGLQSGRPWLVGGNPAEPGEYPCTVLYCTVLYCTVLYCTVLYCAVLY